MVLTFNEKRKYFFCTVSSACVIASVDKLNIPNDQCVDVASFFNVLLCPHKLTRYTSRCDFLPFQVKPTTELLVNDFTINAECFVNGGDAKGKHVDPSI